MNNKILDTQDNKLVSQLTKDDFDSLVRWIDGSGVKRNNALSESALLEVHKGNSSLPWDNVFTKMELGDFIEFMRKYSEVVDAIRFTRKIVTEQTVDLEIPEGKEYSDFVEEIILNDEYDYNNEEAPYGWSEIDAYDVDDIYDYPMQQYKLTVPKDITFAEEVKTEVADE